jgi:hypothetical protein
MWDESIASINKYLKDEVQAARLTDYRINSGTAMRI